MGGILDAIAKAITNHGESAIAALAGIIGTLLGGVVAVVVEKLWASRGKITITSLREDVSFGIRYSGKSGEENKIRGVRNLPFWFELRVLNTFQNDRTLALMDVTIVERKPWYSNPVPVLEVMNLHIGTEPNPAHQSDVLLQSDKFTRVYIEGHGNPFPTEDSFAISHYKRARYIRLRFLISPDVKVVRWIEIPESTRAELIEKDGETKTPAI